MTSIYNIILRLINQGKTVDLEEKVDVLYLNNQLTEREYKDIMARLNPNENSSLTF